MGPGIMEIASKCPGLVSIGIAHCPLITDKGVEAIARCCPNLELLSLSGNERVTDSSILVLAQLCCHLRWLGCRDCNKITDTSLVQVSCSFSRNVREHTANIDGRINVSGVCTHYC